MSQRHDRLAALALLGLLAASCGNSSPSTATAIDSGLVSVAPAATTVPSAVPAAGTVPSAAAHSPSPAFGSLVGTVDSGRILIGIERGGVGLLALAYIDSSGYHEIATAPDTTLAHAVWASPEEIVFDSERAGDRHLFRLAVRDGSVVQLTKEHAQERAGVSSDGAHIVSDHYDPVTNQDLGLQIWSAQGTDPAPLTPVGAATGNEGATQASYSPDGRSIAFIRMSDFNAEIGSLYVVGTDGGEPRRLSDDLNHISYPRWSPDGTSILYTGSTTADAAQGPLLIVPADGSSPARPLFDPGVGNWAFEGDWSPDGKRIVYKFWNGTMNNNQLWTVSSDGTDPQPLWLGESGGAETPDWGP